MGISLNGLTPANTYQSLIKVGDNSQLTATLKTLSDGFGTDLPMQVSTSGVNFTGTLTQNGLPITTTPSGVAGAIQFSDGSAFASDAANLFWDDTNKRLGIGTNAPIGSLEIDATATWVEGFNSNLRLTGDSPSLQMRDKQSTNGFFIGVTGGKTFFAQSTTFASLSYVGAIDGGNWNFGAISNLGAKVNIKGSGSTSATTALLVQNSAGTSLFSVRDDGVATFSSAITGGSFTGVIRTAFINSAGNAFTVIRTNDSNGNATFDYSVAIGTTSSPNATAQLEIVSTTKGFLPPRMTTTQKNAISSPASGLMVYDTDTNKLCCYNGTSWNDLF